MAERRAGKENDGTKEMKENNKNKRRKEGNQEWRSEYR